MATSVQVLCPNGRRQNVKVTPNTKMMQVLEDVCTKQSFLPSDDYELVHGRKSIDLTLAFRFSNLPNNAKLELVKAATSRSQSQGGVIIALQLPNGERKQHTFTPSTSLWEILEYWESNDEQLKGKLTNVDSTQSPPLHPVCIYMRDEIIGAHALKHTTLKKLALISGKAIIRLIHRGVEDKTIAEIMDNIEKEKAKQARMLAKAADNSDQSASSSCVDVTKDPSQNAIPRTDTNTEERMDVDECKKNADTDASGRDEEGKAALQSEPMDTDTDDGKQRSSTSRGREEPSVKNENSAVGAKREEAGSSVNSKNSERREEAGSSVNCKNFGTREKGGAPMRGASSGANDTGGGGTSAIEQLRRMNIPGVEIITPNDFYDLTPEQQQVARLLAERLMPGALEGQQQVPQVAVSAKKPKTTSSQPFAQFKFPEETKGKDLYQNELSQVKHEEFRPCDREAVIYDSNEVNTSKAMAEDVTDDFFEVTDADVKSLYKDLQRYAGEERPLMTEAMRQAEMEQKHQHYEFIVMRIQFPDGLVLQGCFRPRETLYALHKFVREHLEDKEQDFYLYRTPPKQILSDMARTMVQADLAPASLVYFGSDRKEDHSLVSAARKEIAPKRRADELSVKKLAKKQMADMAAEGATCSAPSSTALSQGQGQGQGESIPAASRRAPAQKSSAPSSVGDPKVPKWLKMGKK